MKYFILVITISISAVYCNRKVESKNSLAEIFKSKEYNCIENIHDLKTEKDTILYNIIMLKKGEFTKLKPYLPQLDSFRFVDNPKIESNVVKSKRKLTSLDSFPYGSFTPLQLYYAGYYYSLKNDLGEGGILSFFVMESLRRDSNNVFALYDISRLYLHAYDVGKALYFSEAVLKIDPNWQLAKLMYDYLENEKKSGMLVTDFKTMKENLSDTVSIVPLDPNFTKY